jgi:hypothetical protein
VTKPHLFYLRESHAKAFAFTEGRADYFFSDSKCNFSNATSGQIRQKAVGLNFIYTFFVLLPDQRRWPLALAPGAWPKGKPRGGGSAVSKAALFVGKKNRPPRKKTGWGIKNAPHPPASSGPKSRVPKT